MTSTHNHRMVLGGLGTPTTAIRTDGTFENADGTPSPAWLGLTIGDETRRLVHTDVSEQAVPDLESRLLFPQLRLISGDAIGIHVEVAITTPIVPHHEPLSSLPGFLIHWHVHNRRAEDISVICRLNWPQAADAVPETIEGPGWLGIQAGAHHLAAVYGQGAPVVFEGASAPGVGTLLDLSAGEQAEAVMLVATPASTGDEFWTGVWETPNDILTALLEGEPDIMAAAESLHGLFIMSDVPLAEAGDALNPTSALVERSRLDRNATFIEPTHADDGQTAAAAGASQILFPGLFLRDFQRRETEASAPSSLRIALRSQIASDPPPAVTSPQDYALPGSHLAALMASYGFGYWPATETISLSIPIGTVPILHPHFWGTATKLDDGRMMILIRHLFLASATHQVPRLWVSKLRVKGREKPLPLPRQAISEGTIITWTTTGLEPRPSDGTVS